MTNTIYEGEVKGPNTPHLALRILLECHFVILGMLPCYLGNFTLPLEIGTHVALPFNRHPWCTNVSDIHVYKYGTDNGVGHLPHQGK